jgi:phospholipid N-methyltransferase
MLNNEINEQLASVASVEEGDVVLEIGPGTGSLTNVLINAGAIVLAIEKVSCLEHKAYLLAPVINFMLGCTSFLGLHMMQFGII